MIPYELDITCTPFSDTTIITYEVETPPAENIIGFDLLDDEYVTIPYVNDTIPHSPAGIQPQSQGKRNLWIIAITGEELIKFQGALDELNSHQNPSVKSKVGIIICRRKSYQSTYL